jgi:hypothetical protein
MAKTKQPAEPTLQNMRVSVGAYSNKPCPEIKTSGIKIRGTGAATKGTMARGPMA